MPRRESGPAAGEMLWIAALALLGGLVLNVMPCVLPVLSIKLASAVKAGARDRARIRTGFLVAAAGVLAFMWALAAATLAARAAGLSVGWGLQFQNPVFLTAMIALLVLFAANLWGAFEIVLPWSWQNRLARADGTPGHWGDFAAGAFAAVLATPCSAPFLGTAIAVALAGRAVDVAVIFTALGLGLALPYLAVAAAPGAVRLLPRPGRWMLALKFALGGLLALTAAWLFAVLAGVAGGLVAALVALALALAVAAIWQRHRAPRATLPLALGLVAAAFAAPLLMPPPSAAPAEAATEWTAFDRGDVARRVAAGETVFVDVTADWCLTCKANKALVLDRLPVSDALAAPGVTPMRADWTRPDPAISRYLEGFGRYGIPFNAVFGPAAPDGILLPEILTAEAVIEALGRAGGEVVASD